MDDTHWLQIVDDEVDVDRVMAEIRRRVAVRQAGEQAVDGEDPEDFARKLYRKMVADQEGTSGLTIEDCDILPQDYAIEWRIPVLGPIHAIVRRVINAEIQRYLQAGLVRQSRFNRQILQELERLSQENRELRDRVTELATRGPHVSTSQAS